MEIKNRLCGLHLFALTALFVISGQGVAAAAGEGAKDGDKVSIEYTGTLKDGTVFDSSKNHESPLSFVVGSGQVIKGFDQAVRGMKIGDEKTFTVQPPEAYGEVDAKRIQKVPRSNFPADPEPKVGMGLIVGSPKGGRMRATIREVAADFVTLDMNHPLAGKALTFKIKVTSLEN